MNKENNTFHTSSLFESFDETDSAMTLLTFTENGHDDIEEILDYVQHEKVAEQEVLKDTYHTGYEEGYREGMAAQVQQQLDTTTALVDALHTALGDKNRELFIATAEKAAADVVLGIVENCLPTLLETTFLHDIDPVLKQITQTLANNTTLLLYVHSQDKACLQGVLDSNCFSNHDITLCTDDTQARYSLRACWDNGNGHAVFDPAETTQAFLTCLRKTLTISSSSPEHTRK